jgi:hypothetical protein
MIITKKKDIEVIDRLHIIILLKIIEIIMDYASATYQNTHPNRSGIWIFCGSAKIAF